MVSPNVGNLPSVCVVIPNLNQGKYLEFALLSVINQPSLDIHIAVMDAGSKDISLEIIRKYNSRLSFWRSHPDAGQAAAINEGINCLPRADYVCWLNADDTFLDNGLTKLVDFMETDKSLSAVYSNAYITDTDNKIIGVYPTQPFSINDLAHHCFICQPATLIRMTCWEKVNGVNSDFYMCMDYDLWWRISKEGPIGYLPVFTACSRDHEDTKTRNNKNRHFKEAFFILKKHYGKVPWNWCLTRVKETTNKENIFFHKFLSRLQASYFYFRHFF